MAADVHIDDLESLIGKELGVTAWMRIDQERVNSFADATEDHNPLHVDVDGMKSSEYGGTIAHGFLTLSLLSSFLYEVGFIPTGIAYGLNYGLDRVRFLSPVPVGARVRNRMVLESIERKPNGNCVYKTRNTVEIEGAERPAMVADWLGMFVRERAAAE